MHGTNHILRTFKSIEGVLQPVSEAPIPTDRPPTLTNYIHATNFNVQEEDGTTFAVAPDSTKLPIYQGIIDNQAYSKVILDSAATTIYLRDSLV